MGDTAHYDTVRCQSSCVLRFCRVDLQLTRAPAGSSTYGSVVSVKLIGFPRLRSALQCSGRRRVTTRDLTQALRATHSAAMEGVYYALGAAVGLAEGCVYAIDKLVPGGDTAIRALGIDALLPAHQVGARTLVQQAQRGTAGLMKPLRVTDTTYRGAVRHAKTRDTQPAALRPCQPTAHPAAPG